MHCELDERASFDLETNGPNKPALLKPNVAGVSLRFTDIDPLPLQISGELVLVRSAYENERTQEMTFYNIYCSNSQGAEAILDSLHKMPISTDEAKYEEEFKMDVPKTSLKNCRNILVYTQNKTGESDEAASLEGGVTDRTFPQGKVTSNSFDNHPVDATVYAKLNLITNEILFTHFVFYWADADGNKVGNKIHEIEKGEPTADDSYQINLTDALKNIFVERRGDAEHANLAVHIRNDLGENENHSLIPWEDKIGKIRIVIASEVTFTDEDETQGKLKGTLTITKPLDDLIDGTTLEYKLYFGGADGLTKIGTSIATISSSIVEDMVEHPVSADTNIPANAFYLLVFVVLGGVEQGEPTALLIEDKTPSVLVTGIGFTDTDPEAGEIGGTLSFLEPADNQPTRGIASYEVYWSEDGNMKLPSSTSLATINSVSTDNTINHSIANDQAIPPGANFLLVFTNFTDGTEESEGRAVPINDLHVPVLVVSNVAFSDTDPNEGKIGGALSFQEPSIEEGFNSVTNYNLYLGVGPSSPDLLPFANTSPIAAGGMNQFVVPANTVIPAGSTPHLLVYVVRNGVEESSSSSVRSIPIIDAKIPNLINTEISHAADTDEEANNINIVLSITKETDETNLSHYVLYWGNLSGAECVKIGGMSPIIELPRTGSSISHTYIGSLEGDCILVHLKNSDGESIGSRGTGEIIDNRPVPATLEEALRNNGGLGNVTQYVDPFIGTSYTVSGGYQPSRVYPATVYPFGMVQLTPVTGFHGGQPWSAPDDSDKTTWRRPKLLNAGRNAIGKFKGFSATSFQGPGCNLNFDFPMMVTTSRATRNGWLKEFGRARDSSLVNDLKIKSRYILVKNKAARDANSADQDKEWASPGYYRVKTQSNVLIELTVTQRTGFAKFTFPSSANDAYFFLTSHTGTQDRDSNNLRSFTKNRSVGGENRGFDAQIRAGTFCSEGHFRYVIYLRGEFDRTYSTSSTRSDKEETRFNFDVRNSKVLHMKFSLSYVSHEQAGENLNSENSKWNFAAVKTAADKEWNLYLNAIQIRDNHDGRENKYGTRTSDKRRLYTFFYRSLIHPNIFSDVDGKYVGFDGTSSGSSGRVRIHTLPSTSAQKVQLQYYSGWDIYRSQMPLVGLLYKDVSRDIIYSLANNADQAGPSGNGGFTRWGVANDDSGVMGGDPSSIFISTMHALGVTLDDAIEDRVIAVFNRSGKVDTVSIGNLRNCGFNSHSCQLSRNGGEQGGVRTDNANDGLDNSIFSLMVHNNPFSKILELVSADYSRSQFINRVRTARGSADSKYSGYTTNYTSFLNSSQSWERHLFRNGIIRKNTTCNWSGSHKCYHEGTWSQYQWMIPFDIKGLFAAKNAPNSFDARTNIVTNTRIRGELNTHFDNFDTRSNVNLIARETGDNFNAGNQAGYATPYVYHYIGQPNTTYHLVRHMGKRYYPDGLNSYPGNEDGGSMSSLFAWSLLGLYPHRVGADTLLMGHPFFKYVRIRIRDGESIVKQLTLKVVEGDPSVDNCVASVTLNGVNYTKSYINYSDLGNHDVIEYTLQAKGRGGNRWCQTNWGRKSGDIPPSAEAPPSS